MINPFELQKIRKLAFTDEPPNQTEQAYLLLSGMENMKVRYDKNRERLIIEYSIEHYTREGLELALIKEGFKFKESLFDKLFKHFIHYCEDVQCHNLDTPEHPTKKNESGIFAQVHETHPHLSHIQTSKDHREYK